MLTRHQRTGLRICTWMRPRSHPCIRRTSSLCWCSLAALHQKQSTESNVTSIQSCCATNSPRNVVSSRECRNAVVTRAKLGCLVITRVVRASRCLRPVPVAERTGSWGCGSSSWSFRRSFRRSFSRCPGGLHGSKQQSQVSVLR